MPDRPEIGLQHRAVWRLAGPIILSNISVPLLGAVDTAVIGHLPDPAALGAVGIGATIFSFLYWGFGFLRMSTTGLAAQAWGTGDRAENAAVLYRAGLTAWGIAVALLLLQVPIAWASFAILDAGDRVEELGVAYFNIRIWSAPAVLALYGLLGWFIGQQDARTPLIVQLVMNGLNIVLDLWFVLGLGWGVEGVAAATVIAEYVGLVIGLFVALRAVRGAHPSWRQVADRVALVRMFSVNRDIFIRSLCLLAAFGYFTVQSTKLGDLVLAANTVLMTFLNIASHGLDGFAHAAEALVGGAFGARDRRRFQAAVRTAFLWAAIVAFATTIVFVLMRQELLGLMTDIPEVLDLASQYILWPAIMPIAAVWCFTYDGIYIGATRSADLRNGMILSLIGYLAVLHLSVGPLGNHGLWLAITSLMLLRAATLARTYPRLLASVEGSRPTDGTERIPLPGGPPK